MLYSLRLPLPEGFEETSAPGISWVFDGLALSVSVIREGAPGNERWILESLFDAPPDVAALAERLPFPSDSTVWRVDPVPERDWLAHVHAAHPPFSVGPFFVRESGRTESSPEGAIVLTIDAVTAFGSGSHGTTKGCLEAIGDLAEQTADAPFVPRRILDMGTGSGILGIAAWKVWRAPVLAVDIERESVRVAARHRLMNGVPMGRSGMTCVQGGRFDIRAIVSRAPFDLILANILAGPLREMAGDLCAALSPGGRAVLSGMLREQAEEVAQVYRTHGAVVQTRYDRGEWTTLVLVKSLNLPCSKIM